MSKSFPNRYPLSKLGRKEDFKNRMRGLLRQQAARGCGRGERGISRRGKK